MAVNNRVGSIITKNIVGQMPAIFFDDRLKRYSLYLVVNNLTYNNILDECKRADLEIERRDIDEFIHCMYDFDEACDLIYMDNVSDDQILAGERLRLFGTDGRTADLLKIRQREYICTDGVCAGQIILMPTPLISLDKHVKGFTVSSIAFLPPTEAHYLLDYRYLSIYKRDVSSSIENLYRAVSLAFMENRLESSFPELLNVCAQHGQSTWTLRGIVDFLCEKSEIVSYGRD